MFMYNIYMVNPYIKKQEQNSDRIEWIECTLSLTDVGIHS